MCKAKSKRLVVCNIHVLYNPSRGEVKLGQVSPFTLDNNFFLMHEMAATFFNSSSA